jgi:hypothetical protein
MDLDENIVYIRGELSENTKKYEFNVNISNAIFFKMNLYSYVKTFDTGDEEKLIGVEFLYENEYKPLFTKLLFVDTLQFLKIWIFDQNEDDDFRSDFKSILRMLNDERKGLIISKCIDEDCVLQKLKNIESDRGNNFLFTIDGHSNNIYYHEYVNFILKRSFNKIFENTKIQPKVKPNFLSDQKCNTKFKIVIADLYLFKKEWKEKIDKYLERDAILEDIREGKKMQTPPNSHIEEQFYFHFMALNDDEDIVGYCICSYHGMYVTRTELNNFKKYFKTIEDLNKGGKTDNPNIKLFIDYIYSFANNTENMSSMKNNLFYIESLSTDKAYRGKVEGGSYRIVHFLVYHALLFAMNAHDLNIGLVGVYSAADATRIVLSNYFRFTLNKFLLNDKPDLNQQKKLKETIKFIHLSLDLIYIKKDELDQNEMDEYSIGFEKAEYEIEQNQPTEFERNDYQNINLLTPENLGYKHKYLEYFRLFFMELIRTGKSGIEDKSLDPIFEQYDTNYDVTDVLYIDNPLFHDAMEGYSKRLIDCVEGNEVPVSKKRKTGEREEEKGEREKKRIRIKKHVFSMNQLNKIFG